jgi:hypothetical protein
MRRNHFAVVIAALLMLVATGSYAQETTGTLTGRVVDSQGLAMPGVTVTATGPQGSKSATSDSDGRFRISYLTPGAYDVQAELQGFKTVKQSNVTVGLGQTIELTGLRMEVGGLAETIEVQATSPIIDTTSTTVGATISAETLTRVPIGRKFTDALYIAPGVSNSGSVGNANPSMGGASGLENQYIIDGVNITNSGYGAVGSYSIVFGSLGSGVTFDFVKEIQVKTGGYEAEYGQSTGGVVNVVTKSGTNRLRGTLFGYVRPEALEEDYKQIFSENGTVNTTATSTADVGFEVGGPIIKDRLFFFGAIDPQWETRTFIAPDNVDPDTGDFIFPLRSLGEVDRKREIFTYSTKASWQVTSNNRIDASFFGDPSKGPNGPQRSSALLRTDTAGFSRLDTFGGHNQVVKYDGVISSKWLVEAMFARAQNSIEETPSVNEHSISDRRVSPNIISGGIGFYEVGNDGENMQYQIKSTHLLGNHQIRYGVLYEDIKYDNVIQRTGPTFVLANGERTATGASIQILPEITGLGQIYRVTRANTSNVRNTEQQYTNFFVQDTLRIGDRLTLRPGIRYEQQRLVGNLADFKWDGNWAVRIGGTYDPTGQGRAKIYANWGRFYAKIPNDLAARALSADAGVNLADYYDAALTQPIPNGVETVTQTPGGRPSTTTNHFLTAGTSASEFDPNAKSTYLDESVVGFEFEPITNISLGARYVRRRFGRILEDVGTAAMGQYYVGDVSSTEYFITNPRDGYPATLDGVGAFESAIHDYDAVEVTAEKRFSNNWQLQSSYRWSRLYGTFEGFYRNDNGQSDPAITSLYDFPTNDPTYTELAPEFGFRGDVRYLGKLGAGPLPTDRPHQFKVYGSKTFDFGLNLGAGVVLSSGSPLTALAANPVYGNGGEIPEGPRGSGVQTVDGFKKRTPFENDVNFHADYGIRFGDQRIVLLADVFNLANVQRVRDYDNYTENTFGAINPSYGARLAYQTPRQIRLGVRFEF